MQRIKRSALLAHCIEEELHHLKMSVWFRSQLCARLLQVLEEHTLTEGFSVYYNPAADHASVSSA